MYVLCGKGLLALGIEIHSILTPQILFIPLLIIVGGMIVGPLIAVYIWMNKKHMESDYYRQTGKELLDLRCDKGSLAEYKIGRMLERVEGYKKIIYNCYIPKSSGETTEVDVIMIHEKGLYVIESKNYSGWIFGSENHTKWTQVLRQGRYGSEKHQFYNPIMQNRTHVKWLEKFLEPMNVDTTMYSCIVFGDSCEFKDLTVSNQHYALMYASQLYGSVQWHITHSVNRLDCNQIDAIYDRLYPLTQKSEAEKLRHIYDVSMLKNISNTNYDYPRNDYRINSNVTPSQSQRFDPDSVNSACNRMCPRCGAKLVLRTVKKGDNAGNQFWGCSNYPNCRYTEKYDV